MNKQWQIEGLGTFDFEEVLALLALNRAYFAEVVRKSQQVGDLPSMWSRVLWLFIHDCRLLQAVSTLEEYELVVTSIATRSRLGLSQTELGQLLGVSPTAVATWEREERKRYRHVTPQGRGHRRCLQLILKMLEVSQRTTCRHLLDFADREEVDQEKKQKLAVLRAILT